MLVTMVTDFKRRSRSRGRQVATQNHSQLNITQVGRHGPLNQTVDFDPSHNTTLNQTMARSIQKDRSVAELNHVDFRRLRK